MQQPNWPYLAGLIDGEGHIGITKGCRYWTNKSGVKTKYPAYCLQISIANCEIRLMKYLITHFGGTFYVHTRINPNARLGYNWHPKGAKNKEQLLLAVIPYLVLKTEQAKIALEFLRMRDENNPTKREEMHKRSLQLNHRGVSPTTNTSNGSQPMIESDLIGDYESAPAVTQDAQTKLD